MGYSFRRPTIRGTLMALLIVVILMFGVVAGSLAAANPSGTGQPSQSCGSAGATSMPNGFTTAGFSHAEEVYAGSGVSATTAQSRHAVSQYDVACYQVTSNGH